MVELLSNVYRASIEHLWHISRNSIEHRVKSVDHRSKLNRSVKGQKITLPIVYGNGPQYAPTASYTHKAQSTPPTFSILGEFLGQRRVSSIGTGRIRDWLWLFAKRIPIVLANLANRIGHALLHSDNSLLETHSRGSTRFADERKRKNLCKKVLQSIHKGYMPSCLSARELAL